MLGKRPLKKKPQPTNGDISTSLHQAKEQRIEKNKTKYFFKAAVEEARAHLGGKNAGGEKAEALPVKAKQLTVDGTPGKSTSGTETPKKGMSTYIGETDSQLPKRRQIMQEYRRFLVWGTKPPHTESCGNDTRRAIQTKYLGKPPEP